MAEQYLVGYVDTPVLMYRTRESHSSLGHCAQTTVVFNRHLRSFSFTERLRLKPVLWQRRGWYAWSFLEQVGEYRQQRRYRLAAKAMWNAVRTSPLHIAKLLARSARAKALRPRAAQLVPVAPGPEEDPSPRPSNSWRGGGLVLRDQRPEGWRAAQFLADALPGAQIEGVAAGAVDDFALSGPVAQQGRGYQAPITSRSIHLCPTPARASQWRSRRRL